MLDWKFTGNWVCYTYNNIGIRYLTNNDFQDYDFTYPLYLISMTDNGYFRLQINDNSVKPFIHGSNTKDIYNTLRECQLAAELEFRKKYV